MKIQPTKQAIFSSLRAEAKTAGKTTMPLNITNVIMIAMVPKENTLKNFQTKKSKIVIVTCLHNSKKIWL